MLIGQAISMREDRPLDLFSCSDVVRYPGAVRNNHV